MAKLLEKSVMIIVASRCEVIKMAPVYLACKRAHIPVMLCVTLYDIIIEEALLLFSLQPDIILSHQQSIIENGFAGSFQSIFENIQPILKSVHPTLVIVHGESASSVAVAMASFYNNIHVAHVEAGLRTDDINVPFPDEMQRRVITVVATFHFASTMEAVANILVQGISRDRVFCTGNTGIDALMIIKEKITHKIITIDNTLVNIFTKWHNRDYFIGVITLSNTDHSQQEQEILFSVVKQIKNCVWIVIYKEKEGNLLLRDFGGNIVYIMHDISYKEMVYILDNVDVVLTDSGTVQEEAISLGKPVLILQHTAERMEGVFAHKAQIVGFSPLLIMNGIEHALQQDQKTSLKTTHLSDDGHAAEKIAAFLQVRYPELTQNVCIYEDLYYRQREVV